MVSRYMSNNGQSSRAGGEFYLGKRTDKIEHEGMGICARIEISQYTDNADQKVKRFLKLQKHTNFCERNIFNYLFSQVFTQVHILQTFRFSPP